MAKKYDFQLTENDYELIISGLQVYGNFHWDIFTTTTNEKEKAFSKNEWEESVRTLHEIQTQWRLMPRTLFMGLEASSDLEVDAKVIDIY